MAEIWQNLSVAVEKRHGPVFCAIRRSYQQTQFFSVLLVYVMHFVLQNMEYMAELEHELEQKNYLLQEAA